MRAYERFLEYVKIHTTSDDTTGTHPSTARQFDLARLLADQMRALGMQQVRVDGSCYVYGFLPATPGCEEKPAIGLIAHMDTSPAASGQGVNPQIIEHYDGGEVRLPATGAVMTPARFPCLTACKGETLITADGSTLLGADDKAGVAEILTAVERLQSEKRPHGPVCVAFTPDEEIGEGADGFDVAGFGADFAYTVDGGDVGELEYCNFNAASAVFTVHGFSVHPGSAKGLMRNAANLAVELHAMLPADERPETTEGTEGFYHLDKLTGSVSEARLEYIVRDHDRQKFEARKTFLRQLADTMNQTYGAGTVELQLKDSYYNMEEKIRPYFHLIEHAREAIRQAGLEPKEPPIRGGTDGARLSWMGLPCPNLGTGGFNFHGPCECITAERMDKSVEILLNILALYAA